MAEYYRDSGKHALIVYDDLSSRPWPAHRQMRVPAARRPPGREAFRATFSICIPVSERAAKLSG